MVMALILLASCGPVPSDSPPIVIPSTDQKVVHGRMVRLHASRWSGEPDVWCDTVNGTLIYSTFKGGVAVILDGCSGFKEVK